MGVLIHLRFIPMHYLGGLVLLYEICALSKSLLEILANYICPRETPDPNHALPPSVLRYRKMLLVIKGNGHWTKLELLTPPFRQSGDLFGGRSESKR
jgi:hypothetical protein